jgi:hypothetical protein
VGVKQVLELLSEFSLRLVVFPHGSVGRNHGLIDELLSGLGTGLWISMELHAPKAFRRDRGNC